MGYIFFQHRVWRVQGLQFMDDQSQPFWKSKTLEEMSDPEWESICDGCGRCCLVKLEDEDTGRYYATDIACRLLDTEACRCGNYADRQSLVPDCVRLTPKEARSLGWLPPTCGYRLLAEGKDLAWWHPLVSGTQATVIEAGVSVKGRVHCSEDEIAVEDFVGRIKKWPLVWPKSSKVVKGPTTLVRSNIKK